MELWHGSQKIIETPQLGLGKVHNDYGQGFYCTESLDLAREWACSRDADGLANRYELDMADLKVLDLLSPQYSVLHWIALLVEHRSFRKDTAIAVGACEYLHDHFLPDTSAYDVIRGWRADDSYFSYARAFVNNTITVDRLGRSMRLGNLGEQIVLKSERAFKSIRFAGFERAPQALYGPLAKERDEVARAQYRELLAENPFEGIRIVDIIREGMTAMTHAYSEMYLEDAMRTLGEAVDFALCDQGLTPAELTAILSNAFEMKQFERGIPRVVCGMAGDELARDIIAHAGLTPVECRETYPFDRSPQYWAGWVLAYAQWMCSLGFNELLEVASLDWIIGSYHPLHEASEDKFAQIVIEKWNNAQADKKGLKAARKAARLTQKQLAAQSGVKLRAIQLYEQNQLDLRRASVSSALALANTLDCSIEDLIWQPIVLEYDSQSFPSTKL